MRKPLVVGNWKMHGTVPECLKLATGLEHHLKAPMDVDIVVAPPHTALYSIGVALQETQFRLAGQNLHWEEKGPYTGEVAAPFLKDVGCDFVIVGHSERRTQLGETDELVNKKLEAALRNELEPILCVGETAAEREHGETPSVLARQIKRAMAGLHYKDLEHFVVAYEPVWAIGTGQTPTPGQIHEAHHFIRNLLEKLFDAPTAALVRILYGGSVTPETVGPIAKQEEVDGFLVGGASLHPEQFAEIVRTMDLRQRKGS